MIGAGQLGMKTVFARYGDTFGTKVSHADYDVTDVAQIIDIVKNLNGRK
jgi:putative hydrolase of the HAD superfamily